jgi:hypothetical protein
MKINQFKKVLMAKKSQPNSAIIYVIYSLMKDDQKKIKKERKVKILLSMKIINKIKMRIKLLSIIMIHIKEYFLKI